MTPITLLPVLAATAGATRILAAAPAAVSVPMTGMRGPAIEGVLRWCRRWLRFLFRFRSRFSLDGLALGGSFRFRRLRHGRGNFGRGSGPQTRGCFLRFDFPVGPAKAFGSRQIPAPGFVRPADGFEITREFERHHRIPRFGEEIC